MVPTVFCYWGGEMVQNHEEGLSYSISHQKVFKLPRNIGYEQLLQKLFEKIGISPSSNRLKLTCRYPYPTTFNQFKYMPLCIEDDDTLTAMFDVANQNERTFVELYVEIEQLSRNVDEIGTSRRRNPSRNSSCRTSLQNTGLNVSTSFEAVCRLAENINTGGSDNCSYEYIYGDLDENEEEDPDFEVDEEEEEEEEEEVQVNTYATPFRMPPNISASENEGYSGFQWPGHVPDGIPLHQPMSSYITQPGTFDVSSQWNNDQFVIYPGTWDPEFDEPFVGLYFRDQDMMKKGLKLWSVKRNRHFVSYKTKKDYWEVRCRYFDDSPNSCKWRIRGSLRKKHGFYEVSKYHGPHTCVHSTITNDHPQIDASLVALTIQKSIEEDPTINLKALKNIVEVRFNKVVSYKKLWVGKQKAVANIFGSWESSYAVLPKFMQAIQKYNPGTIAHYVTTPSYDVSGNFTGEVLDKFFFTFPPVVEAFQHCRPVIGIDGTHLYGKYKGKLLLAMTFDADNHVFPVACAFVGEESTEAWSYFIQNVMLYVVKDRENVCLVSDRHAGIINAVNNVWYGPGFVHRYCANHFYENFRKAFKGDTGLHKIAKNAIWELQEKKLIKIMAEIEKMNPEAHAWLLNEPPPKWSNFYDNGKRHGAMTTNMVEIFNNVLKGARCLPITAAVQLIFYKLVQLFGDRRNLVAGMRNNGIRFGGNIQQKINERQFDSGHATVVFDMISGNFSVKTSTRYSRGGNTQVVNFVTSECDCGKWQSDKIPCSHVQAICADQHFDWETFVSPYYKIDRYEATYAPRFYPLRDEAYWDQCDRILLPDVSRIRAKGRPRSTRIRNGMDQTQRTRQIRCSSCQVQGHDTRTCPNPSAHRRRH